MHNTLPMQLNNPILNKIINLSGNFAEDCFIKIKNDSLHALKEGRLKVNINQHGQQEIISNLKIIFNIIRGNINIFIGGNDCEVLFCKETIGIYDLRIWKNSKIIIGPQTTSNGIKIVSNNSTVIVGDDCMFSDDVLIQSSDQHGLIDINNHCKIYNSQQRHVNIGKHVWVCRKATITPDTTINNGSIIGTGSIVTHNVPKNSVAAGAPAKTIKSNVTWSRNLNFIDKSTNEYLKVNNASK
jgi:acetyltransferase-like isoleucine patch superfamily enzyme